MKRYEMFTYTSEPEDISIENVEGDWCKFKDIKIILQENTDLFEQIKYMYAVIDRLEDQISEENIDERKQRITGR